MEAISDLPMLHDMDADYSPQYVKLARILRAKIEAGEYRSGDRITALALTGRYKVSKGVALHALAMLAANRYLADVPFQPYYVTWDTTRGRTEARR